MGKKATTQVLFEVMELRNLPWLAGRGYNTWGVYFSNVRCDRVSPPRTGSYLAVLFESFTDPIITGREELGFPKVWAELPDGQLQGASRTHTASWLGFEFMRLEIHNLKQHDPKTAPSLGKRPFTHPTQDGILHHRYVPTVGCPGKHDASYAIFCPPPPGKAPVTSYWAPFSSPEPSTPKDRAQTDATVLFSVKAGTFEQLPTLYNIVDGLASLQLTDVVEVAVQEFQGASDLSECRQGRVEVSFTKMFLWKEPLSASSRPCVT